ILLCIGGAKEPEGGAGLDLDPGKPLDRRPRQGQELFLTGPMQVPPEDLPLKSGPFDQEQDGDALRHSFKDVLVPSALRLLSRVAVKVERIDSVEGAQKRAPEPSERGRFQAVVIDHEGNDSRPLTIDNPLSQPEELHIVIEQPLGIPFLERRPVYLEEVPQEV